MEIKEALALGDRGVISIIGAGGKTSLMYCLARELVSTGKKVLTTTTTKIFMPTREESPATIVNRSPEKIVDRARALLENSSHLTAASEYMQGWQKLNGLEPSAIKYILESDLFDFIIIEADGAARRSLKACASHEPVVPFFSDIIVAVAGLDVMAKPLTEEWVFRSTIFSGITGLEPFQEITESSIASVMIHDMSKASASGGKCCKIAFLNKADTSTTLETGERIAALIEKNGKDVFQRVVIGELQAQPAIRVCKVIQ